MQKSEDRSRKLVFAANAFQGLNKSPEGFSKPFRVRPYKTVILVLYANNNFFGQPLPDLA